MRRFLKKTLPVCLLGLVAGLINGLLGAGGGIVIVLGLKKRLEKERGDTRSLYTSALAVMLPLSLVSVWRYARAGQISTARISAFLLPALLGGALGALLLRRFSPRVLSRLFSALVLMSGILLLV